MKILVPIDFSKASRKGVSLAVQLKKSNPKIVLHSLFTITPQKSKTTKLAHKMREIELEEVTSLHKSELKSFFGKDLKSFDKHCIEKGDTAKKIYRKSHDKGYDMVIMGTKGANVAKEVFIGTKTFEFLKMSKIPVIIVPQKWEESPVRKCCVSLKMDQFVAKETGILLDTILKLGLKIKLISAVANHDSKITPRIDFRKSSYKIEMIKSKNALKGIKAFVTDKKPDMLALKYHTHNFVESMLESSLTHEFAFRSMQPILFIK